MATRHVGPDLGQIALGAGHWVQPGQLAGTDAFLDDGRVEADNNIAERALRGVAIGWKNYLHFGSDGGGDTTAVIYTLMGTAKLCSINPQAYLRYVLERIADHHINRIDELLPWAVAQHLGRSVAQPLPLAA